MTETPAGAPHDGDLAARLAEAEAALQAVADGAVDALASGRGASEAAIVGLPRADSFFVTLVTEMQDATASLDANGTLLYANPRFAELLGLPPTQVLGRTIDELTATADRTQARRLVDQGARGPVRGTLELLRADGRIVPVSVSAAPIAGEPPEICLVATDLTERRQAEQRFRTAFDGAPIGICLLSLDPRDPGRLLQVNPALAEILGSSVQQLTGAPVSSLTRPEDLPDFYAKLHVLAEGHRDHVEFETRFMHRNGHPIWALISAAPLADGDPTLAVTHVMDISDRKASEGKLQHLADHDALTGLFNRRRFTEELERALRHAKRFDEPGAVLFVDLDGFKFVNDTSGHAVGDELITRVAGLLADAVRETDVLARMGGDEFAVLLSRCDEAAAVLVADKLLSTLRRNALIRLDDPRAHVSSSIGIAVFAGDEGLSADEIVVEADIAMYNAKEAGKDRYAVYDRAEGRRALMSVRQSWNERLQRAISDDGFVLHAQPITAICANGAPWFELLLRLPDDHGDLIPPGTFLYNAERFGLMQQIDRWVLERAVRHLHGSHAAGTDLMLSVNVSGTTMGDPKLDTYVAELLARYPISPDRLIIEVTETAAITNIEGARSLAKRLRTLGCKLALDDFGAGFASFYYLKHLEFDYLKIDGEFISNLLATPTDQLVVEAIVTIARGLHTRTVAEFVGDEDALECITRLGVDYAQGYHLGRPGPLDEALTYLMETA